MNRRHINLGSFFPLGATMAFALFAVACSSDQAPVDDGAAVSEEAGEDVGPVGDGSVGDGTVDETVPEPEATGEETGEKVGDESLVGDGLAGDTSIDETVVEPEAVDEEIEAATGEEEAPAETTSETTTAAAKYTSVAPGGGGAFSAVAVSPDDPNIIFYGANVGGVMRSLDGGVSWYNVTNGMMSKLVLDLKFASANGTTTLLVATPMGIYVSNNTSGNSTIGDKWELITDGLYEGFGVTDFYHPIQSLAVDPKNPDTFWAGIGLLAVTLEKEDYPFEVGDARCDPYHIYKCSVTGKSCAPVFSLQPEYIGKSRSDLKTTCANIDDQEPQTGFPSVFSIAFYPDNSDFIAFATGAGLYLTSDGGTTFYRMGKKAPGKSQDGGKIYLGCSAASPCKMTLPDGSALSLTDASCTEGAFENACLPITSQMGETQPLVKGVDIAAVGGKSRMCVATLDTGYGETGGLCKSSDTAVRDTGFAQYRGGLWCSDNMGKSWTYRKEAKDNPSSTLGNWIRCGSDGDTKDTTTYNKAKINPQNLDHLIVSAATGRGATSGIWEHRIFENGVYEWQNMASAHAGSSKVQKGLCYVGAATKLNITNENCFEGNRSGDLFQDNYAPELLPSSAFHVSNWDDLTKFALRFITGRGAIKATWKDGSNWSDGKGRYYLDHEHTSPVSSGITSIMSVWKGSGASDYCPSGGLAFLDDAGVNLVSAGGDSGLLRSTDGGGSWRLVRDSVNYLTDWKIPSDFHFDDADAEILLDDDNKIIYASNYSAKTSESSNSVVTAPADQPDSWSVLGGYCYSTTTDSSGGAVCGTSDDNGLPGSVEVYDLALDFSRTEDRRVLAGAKGGLYLYDPQKTSPQWTLFSGNGCLTPESGETIKVKGLWTDKEYPNLILAAFYSNASVYETEMARSGIYAVTLNETSYSCEKLGASETSPKLRTPTLVTLAESGGTISLVTAGIYRGYPVLYYSPVTLTGGKADASSVDWQLALDFNYTISKNIPSDTATNWKAYLADHADWKTEYEHEYFSKKSFSTLETVPGRRDIVLAGMNGSPSYDYHVVGHLYESVDGGKTFKVAEKWDDLPMKSMAQINFSPDNKKIYFSTACTSIWEACNSYVEENACVE